MLLLMLQSPEQASQQIPKVLSKPMVAVKSQKLVLAFNPKALSNWIQRFPWDPTITLTLPKMVTWKRQESLLSLPTAATQ